MIERGPRYLQKAGAIVRKDGTVALAQQIVRKLRGGRMLHFGTIRMMVHGRVGLELGGPSQSIFGNLVPVYRHALRIDNCNFAPKTIWEPSTVQGQTFRFSSQREPGMQYICEANDLSHIEDDTYDFVMSSHVIEHIANPLRALKEWRRVIKPDGAAIFVAPHRDYTFDHRRPLTTLRHMIDDFERSVGEDDQTHLQETLDLIDYSMIPFDRDRLTALGRDVLNTRALHHHTFNETIFRELLSVAGFDVVLVRFEWPHHIVAVALRASSIE